jgi:hypothetical protein
LDALLDKAMDRIGDECVAFAVARPDRPQPRQETPRSFNEDAFIAWADEQTRSDWRKTRTPSKVALHYLSALYDEGMSRRDAVQSVADAYRFPTWRAAFDYLKRLPRRLIGAGMLPPDYPDGS